MAVTYNKLWHILLDRGMKKKDLKEAAGLTSHAMMKLCNNEDITTQTIGKICKALGCQADDIMEFVEQYPFLKNNFTFKRIKMWERKFDV